MKKILAAGLLSISLFSISSVSAYIEHNIQSANFIAEKGIINSHADNVPDYNLDFNITRREVLKVMMNLSGKTVPNTCTGAFSDMGSSDWGCKYAEAALSNGYIASNNIFRPNDNVTLIEALKMIMQAKGLERDANDDWRAGYVSKAQDEDLIDDGYLEYNSKATRAWIFSTSARSYSDFTYETPEVELDPEIEDLFNSLLEL